MKETHAESRKEGLMIDPCHTSMPCDEQTLHEEDAYRMHKGGSDDRPLSYKHALWWVDTAWRRLMQRAERKVLHSTVFKLIWMLLFLPCLELKFTWLIHSFEQIVLSFKLAAVWKLFKTIYMTVHSSLPLSAKFQRAVENRENGGNWLQNHLGCPNDPCN